MHKITGGHKSVDTTYSGYKYTEIQYIVGGRGKGVQNAQYTQYIVYIILLRIQYIGLYAVCSSTHAHAQAFEWGFAVLLGYAQDNGYIHIHKRIYTKGRKCCIYRANIGYI